MRTPKVRIINSIAGSVLSLGLSVGMGVGLLVAVPATAHAASRPTTGIGHAWPGHPGRRIVIHVVRRGDTATGLAVRFHAWTRELLAINHLTPTSPLVIGRHLKIPVVVAANRRARHPAKRHPRRHPKQRHHRRSHPPRHHWVGPDLDRRQVHKVVVHTAKRRHVDSALALAVAWQESGWQERVRSWAGALGVMQVLPATGRGLSRELGRRLLLRETHDNVTAGVLLLHELGHRTSVRRTIAGYYQGPGSLHQHGMYRETKRYVASVLAIKRRLRRGWLPY